MKKYMFYNAHIHTFRDIDIPDRFLPLALVKILRTKVGFYLLSTSLKRIIPFTDKDMFDRYVRFIRIGRKRSQQEIFENCRRFYPDDTHFIILSMDMAYMKAGKVPRPFPEQLKELSALKETYPQIIPFMHADPRRKGVFELFKECVQEWGFGGIKLYPPLGYFPYDERLDDIYAYCQDNNLPVLAHCSPYNPVRYKGSKSEVRELLKNSRIRFETDKVKKKVLCSYFAHPENYKFVTEKFPELRICFAHFGSEYMWERFFTHPEEEDNWFRIIKQMIAANKNYYADISFTMNNTRFFPLLKVLLSDPAINRQILFGSDYYMVEIQADERRFGIDLRGYLGEEMFMKIARENVQGFLGGCLS